MARACLISLCKNTMPAKKSPPAGGPRGAPRRRARRPRPARPPPRGPGICLSPAVSDTHLGQRGVSPSPWERESDTGGDSPLRAPASVRWPRRVPALPLFRAALPLLPPFLFFPPSPFFSLFFFSLSLSLSLFFASSASPLPPSPPFSLSLSVPRLALPGTSAHARAAPKIHAESGRHAPATSGHRFAQGADPSTKKGLHLSCPICKCLFRAPVTVGVCHTHHTWLYHYCTCGQKSDG